MMFKPLHLTSVASVAQRFGSLPRRVYLQTWDPVLRVSRSSSHTHTRFFATVIDPLAAPASWPELPGEQRLFSTLEVTKFAPVSEPRTLATGDTTRTSGKEAVAVNKARETLAETQTLEPDFKHPHSDSPSTVASVLRPYASPAYEGALSTPQPSNNIRWKVLEEDQPVSPCPLEKLLVVIDLDETLFFSHLNPNSPHDFSVVVDQQEIFVSLRPGSHAFLEWCREHFETGLYTAGRCAASGLLLASGPLFFFAQYQRLHSGTENYARALLKALDPEERLIPVQNRRYRQSCWPVQYDVEINGKSLSQTLYAKDLASFRDDLSRVVLIDNSLFSFILQPDNGIPIADWRGVDPSSPEGESQTEATEAQQPTSATVLKKVSEPCDVASQMDNTPVSLLTTVAQDPCEPSAAHEALSKRDRDGASDEEQNATRTDQSFGDFVAIKRTLEELKHVSDVKPVLRHKFRLVDQIVQRCIRGMMQSGR